VNVRAASNPPAGPSTLESGGMAAAATAAFLFVYSGRIAELMVMYVGISFRIALITLVIAGVTTVLSGGLKRALGNPVGLCYLLFTVWVILCIPFSVYRRGAYEMVKDTWMPTVLCFICVAGGLRTIADCRRALFALAAGAGVITLMAFVKRMDVSGRLFIEGISLGNPNYVALHILYGAPFLVLAGIHFKLLSWRGVFASAGAVAALWVVVLTGSRGALLAAMLGAMTVLWFVSPGAKIKFSIAGVLMLLMLIPVVPQRLRDRYLFLFTDDVADIETDSEAQMELESAALSGEARRGHLRDSIRMTFEKPLFGAGAGQFMVASTKEAEKAGLPPVWRVTHNAYTEISSETGLPGFLLYMTPLVWVVRRLYRTVSALRGNAEAKDIWITGVCILVSFSMFLVNAFFTSVAYMPYFPLLVGISLVFVRAVEAEVPNARPATGPVLRASITGTVFPPRRPIGPPRVLPIPQSQPDVRNRRIRNSPAR
jgi:O-antigen ligase